jgi:hypothetical protein
MPDPPTNTFPDEFLNPRSMITPGVAGSITMLITNTLGKQFDLPPNYTGLVLSCLIGLIVFRAVKIPHLGERVLYYIINSLIIFSVAVGTNQAGVGAAKSLSAAGREAQKFAMYSPLFVNWLDGTVPQKQKLLGEVNQMSEAESKRVAETIGFSMGDYSLFSSKELLNRFVKSARSADELKEKEKVIKSPP